MKAAGWTVFDYDVMKKELVAGRPGFRGMVQMMEELEAAMLPTGDA